MMFWFFSRSFPAQHTQPADPSPHGTCSDVQSSWVVEYHGISYQSITQTLDSLKVNDVITYP